MSARREAERVYPGCQAQTGPPRRWWRCSYLSGGRDAVSVKSWRKILAAPVIAITARCHNRRRGNLDRPWPLLGGHLGPPTGENPHPAHRSAGACWT
jgi:hypothetical protein